MKRLPFLALMLITFSASAQFDKYFYNKSLRIDYIHSGNAVSDYYAIDELIDEPYWGGSHLNLISPFDYGNFKFTVTDVASGNVIYSQGFSSLFSEWQTTAEAKLTNRAFPENVVFPYPRKAVVVEFYNRQKDNAWLKVFSYNVDPQSYFIRREHRLEYPSFDIHQSGDPSICLDIVIIPEGYTAGELDKFRADCTRLSDFLLQCSPFSDYASKINIVGVAAPSAESGADIPGKEIWKKTLVNSNFYTFNIERYLTTTDMKSVRDAAANAPYDAICVLVNSEVYGGGGIYNYYALFTSDNAYANYVFVHEFGHSMAGLGDEYYTSDVAYQDFYNLKVEPWEPNLTTLVNFDAKWKSMVSKGAPIPTPEADKKEFAVGAYEGGGYVAKGVYRPSYDCTMKSLSYNNFCPVCNKAVRDMLEFYTH